MSTIAHQCSTSGLPDPASALCGTLFVGVVAILRTRDKIHPKTGFIFLELRACFCAFFDPGLAPRNR